MMFATLVGLVVSLQTAPPVAIDAQKELDNLQARLVAAKSAKGVIVQTRGAQEWVVQVKVVAPDGFCVQSLDAELYKIGKQMITYFPLSKAYLKTDLSASPDQFPTNAFIGMDALLNGGRFPYRSEGSAEATVFNTVPALKLALTGVDPNDKQTQFFLYLDSVTKLPLGWEVLNPARPASKMTAIYKEFKLPGGLKMGDVKFKPARGDKELKERP